MSEHYTLDQLDAREEWNRRVMAEIDAMVELGVRPSGKTAEGACGIALVLELNQLKAQTAAAIKVADGAVETVLDSELLRVTAHGDEWFDIATALDLADAGVCEMLGYLTVRGKIRRCPNNPNLVQVVAAPVTETAA